MIETGVKRLPHILLRSREILRHQQAVDENGAIVGYVRWKLPEGREKEWREAQIPDVSKEKRREF